MTRFRWLFVCLLVFGCSDDLPPPAFDGGGGACGPGTCTGCCNGDSCINPPSNAACGLAGFPCVVCGPGETCTNGQCIGSSTCGPATCGQGCCHNNQCQPGNINNACGQGGALCADCTANGGTCQGKTCQGAQPCGPQTCQGCCSQNQCFNGGDATRCGSNGVPCQDCTESNKSCDPQSGNCITGPPPTCDPTTCGSGCCQGNKCVPGNTDGACGQGGNGCVDCTNLGQSCDPTTHTCGGPPPGCAPGNCNGCCQNNQCLPGAHDGACGMGGVNCVDCAAGGKICNAGSGTCTGGGPSCGPGSCPGCCDGTQCNGGTDNWSCGLGGVPCQDCGAAGGTCDGSSGTCSSPPQCGPGNCNGCCSGNTCLPGTSKSDCGQGGAQCKSCSKGYHSCSSGVCEIDPTSKWEMTVIKASINQAKVWDSWLVGNSKKPDPYFGVDWSTCSQYSIDSPCTGTESNNYDPEWWKVLGTFTAGEIKGGWCAFIGDADGVAACTPPFETIALCPVKVYNTDLESGGKTITSCPCVDGNNYTTYLEFKFVYTP